MISPGPLELLIVFAVALLLFGSRRLPEVARTLGTIMTELRRASRDFQDQLMRDVNVEAEPPARHPETPPADIGGGVQEPRGLGAPPAPAEGAAEDRKEVADPLNTDDDADDREKNA